MSSSCHFVITLWIVFCQAVREGDTVQLAHELKLSSASVQYQMKKGVKITGFDQVAKPYVLCDGAVKAFNESRELLLSLTPYHISLTPIQLMLVIHCRT